MVHWMGECLLHVISNRFVVICCAIISSALYFTLCVARSLMSASASLTREGVDMSQSRRNLMPSQKGFTFLPPSFAALTAS